MLSGIASAPLWVSAQQLLIVLLIVVLLFGAAKLPELARGAGQALRIFRDETKGLTDDNDADSTPQESQRRDSSGDN